MAYLAKLQIAQMAAKDVSHVLQAQPTNPCQAEVEIVRVVKKPVRRTNRNLTESRREKIESFRRLNEESPAMYGVPGSTKWMSGLLKHINELNVPNSISIDNLETWLETNPHIRRSFAALIPPGEFGLGVFSNDLGTVSERRRRCKRSSVYSSEFSSIPNSLDTETRLSDVSILKRMKIEPKLKTYTVEMDDLPGPGKFPLNEEEEPSTSSETESVVECEEEIDVGTEIEDSFDEKRNSQSATVTPQNIDNVVRDDVSSNSIAESSSAAINDQRTLETSTAVPKELGVMESNQYSVMDGEPENWSQEVMRPPTPGNFLNEVEYSRYDEPLLDLIAAFADTSVSVAASDTNDELFSDIDIGMRDGVTSSTFDGSKIEQHGVKDERALVGDAAIDFGTRDSDEAYVSGSSSEMISLPWSSTADPSEQNNGLQPPSSTSAYLGRSIECLSADVDENGQLVVEITSVDGFTYGCNLMTKLRQHFQNYQEFHHCLPLMDTMEFIYKSNEYREFIHRSQAGMNNL